MLSKNRTYLLLVILAVMLGLYFLLTYNTAKESNFRTQLIEFDTAVVNRIEVSPPFPAEKIILIKKEGNWFVEQKSQRYAADNSLVRRMMVNLDEIPVKSVAATSSDQWENFKTTEKDGTSLQFISNDKVVGNIILGKFDYIQPKNQQPDPYGRQPQGEMLSYARIPDEENVYTIDGMISLGMGKSGDDFRDRKLTALKQENIREVKFDFTNGEDYQLTKQDGHWKIQGTTVDSLMAVKYLRTLSNQHGREFAADQNTSVPTFAVLTVDVEGEALPVEIKVYAPDTSAYFLVSSMNPTNVIRDADKSITEKLVVEKEFFITGAE